MSNLLRYFLIALLIFALVLVRRYEEALFYDPFLEYFHGRTGRAYYPDYNLNRVIGSVSLRYILNSAISVFIIRLLFDKMLYTHIALGLYLLFFVLLLPSYVYLVTHYFELGQNIGFTIRRLLLQPLLLLLLVPAFYYVNMNSTKST